MLEADDIHRDLTAECGHPQYRTRGRHLAANRATCHHQSKADQSSETQEETFHGCSFASPPIHFHQPNPAP